MARLLLALSLALLAACSTETERLELTGYTERWQPVGVARYPVVLVSGGEYSRLRGFCRRPEELFVRKEFEIDDLHESWVIDSAGMRYRVGGVRMVKHLNSTLERLLSMKSPPVAVTFGLQPAGMAARGEMWKLLTEYQDECRACGLRPGDAPAELMRGFSNPQCVYPPL